MHSFVTLLFVAHTTWFSIAHQSPSTVAMVEGGEAVPLYCVASNHTSLHCYQCENTAGDLSVSTPVLWVNKADTYKCVVKESEDSSAPECYSAEICVHGIIYTYMT